jgi:hypothetical protein
MLGADLEGCTQRHSLGAGILTSLIDRPLGYEVNGTRPMPLIGSCGVPPGQDPTLHGVPPRSACPTTAHGVLTTVSTTAAKDHREQRTRLPSWRNALARWSRVVVDGMPHLVHTCPSFARAGGR